MPRRGILKNTPGHEAQVRARAGYGHDMTAPVQQEDGTVVPALVARASEPSRQMLDTIGQVMAWITEHGGTHLVVRTDVRYLGHASCLMVCWKGPLPARQVAEEFSSSHRDDGTPLIPGWLSLRNDDDFDLRWQPTYGDPAHGHIEQATLFAAEGA